MEDSLLRWALRPRQIGSGWSRASLSAVKVSHVISLGAKGSPIPAPSCLSWLRHLSNSQLFLSAAVQKEIEDPQVLQAEVVRVVTDADTSHLPAWGQKCVLRIVRGSQCSLHSEKKIKWNKVNLYVYWCICWPSFNPIYAGGKYCSLVFTSLCNMFVTSYVTSYYCANLY